MKSYHPALAARISHLAMFAGSKATTTNGQLPAAVRYYRANRKKKLKVFLPSGVTRSGSSYLFGSTSVPLSRDNLGVMRGLTPDVREDKRLKADPAFRKKWTARQRRVMAKLTVEDALFKKADTVIERASRCGAKLDYPAHVIDEKKALTDHATTLFREVEGTMEEYSGDTVRKWRWGLGRVRAETLSDKGDAYSRTCKYRKTDAKHLVTFSVDGVRELSRIPEDIRRQSRLDGFPLISAHQEGTRCAGITYVSNGKPLATKTSHMAWGWYEGTPVTYHGSSKDAASKGIARKIELMAAHAAMTEQKKRGLPPLFVPVVTVSDVRRLTGWCVPGCRQWVSRALGKPKAAASWGEVASAAMQDKGSYGQRLRELLGVTQNGPYTFNY